MSVFFSLRAIQIYMIDEAKYYLSLVSKNIFSAALPFYQSHVVMANKYKDYCTAEKLHKEFAATNDFLDPVSVS